METVALIRPKGINHNRTGRTLPGRYDSKGKALYIDNQGHVKSGGPGSGASSGDIRFTEIMTEHPISKGSKDSESIEAEIAFWKRHPLVEDINGDGKPESLFTIEVVDDTKRLKKAKASSINTVLSTVFNMSAQKMEDVMYFFGRNPKGMNHEDIRLELIDMDSGLLIGDSDAADRFLKHFSGAMSADLKERVDMLTYTKKGILTGFITVKESKMYHDETLIGRDDDDIILFLRDNPKVYENLIHSLSMEGDITAAKEKEAVKIGTSNIDTPEAIVERFKKKYKQYKLAGRMNADFNKLVKRVHEFEKAEGLELTPVD